MKFFHKFTDYSQFSLKQKLFNNFFSFSSFFLFLKQTFFLLMLFFVKIKIYYLHKLILLLLLRFFNSYYFYFYFLIAFSFLRFPFFTLKNFDILSYTTVFFPKTRDLYSLLRSPFIYKKSFEQFGKTFFSAVFRFSSFYFYYYYKFFLSNISSLQKVYYLYTFQYY